MQNITSVISLREAIQTLEQEQSAKEQILRVQFRGTMESLRPGNLIKHALKDMSSSPHLMDNILSTILGIGSGYLSNKIFVGRSANIVRNILGSVLQFGVTNAVALHPEKLKSFGEIVMHYFANRKQINTRKT